MRHQVWKCEKSRKTRLLRPWWTGACSRIWWGVFWCPAVRCNGCSL